MVPISKEEALRLIDGSSKRLHSVLSARLMKALARILHEDEDEWELVGLLHDLDYDLVQGDMSRHGIMAAEMLQGKLPERGLNAIKSHDHRTGVKPQSLLDESLIFADSLAVLLEDRVFDILADACTFEKTLRDEFEEKPWISENIRSYFRRWNVSLSQILREL